jgi:hypothetical protein
VRGRAIRPLIALASCWIAATALAAPTESLSIAAQPELRVGQVAGVDVLVSLVDSRQPLMLTLTVEGEAVEVLRGRLLRDDAILESDGSLRFRVPLLARKAGSALLRAEIVTYRCRRVCDPLLLADSSMLKVGGHAQ